MRRFALLLLAALFVLPACSDDDSVTPGKNFSLTINVVDTSGDPVPNLELSLWNDSDLLQGKTPDKAATKIEMVQPIAARVRLTIEDIEGQTIRVVLDEELFAGSRYVMWNALDDEDIPQPSGRYTARLQGFDIETDELSYDGSFDIWLAMPDLQAGQVGAATDRNGQIVLTDMRLFPHLYDRPPMIATDENGQTMGVFTLTSDMVFGLLDPVGGAGMSFHRQITGSGDVVTLMWDPQPRKAPSLPVAGPQVATPDKRAEDPLPGWALWVYPNPFN